LNVALAFAISTLFANFEAQSGGAVRHRFVSAGALYLGIGVIIVLAMKNRLANRVWFRPTVAELRKDKEWLTKEL